MVLGLASWQRMGVEEFPDVDFPFVVVYTNYPGASPETVESAWQEMHSAGAVILENAEEIKKYINNQ